MGTLVTVSDNRAAFSIVVILLHTLAQAR